MFLENKWRIEANFYVCLCRVILVFNRFMEQTRGHLFSRLRVTSSGRGRDDSSAHTPSRLHDICDTLLLSLFSRDDFKSGSSDHLLVTDHLNAH